jgi:hypothetical protein
MSDETQERPRMTQPAWIPSFDEGLKRLGFLENESSVPPAATLRRRLHQPEANPLETLTLIETEQGFKWELGTGLRPVGLRSARRGVLAGAAPIGAPIWTSHFEKLQPGKLKGLLDRIDTTLTPSYGLSAWTKTGIVPVEKSSANKPKQRVLLLVHGTFSHGKMYEEALTQEHGKDFLTWALAHYDFSSVVLRECGGISVSTRWLSGAHRCDLPQSGRISCALVVGCLAPAAQ